MRRTPIASPTNNSAVARATTSSTANPRSRIPPRNAAAYASPIERRSVISIAAKSVVCSAMSIRVNAMVDG